MQLPTLPFPCPRVLDEAPPALPRMQSLHPSFMNLQKSAQHKAVCNIVEEVKVNGLPVEQVNLNLLADAFLKFPQFLQRKYFIIFDFARFDRNVNVRSS